MGLYCQESHPKGLARLGASALLVAGSFLS